MFNFWGFLSLFPKPKEGLGGNYLGIPSFFLKKAGLTLKVKKEVLTWAWEVLAERGFIPREWFPG